MPGINCFALLIIKASKFEAAVDIALLLLKKGTNQKENDFALFLKKDFKNDDIYWRGTWMHLIKTCERVEILRMVENRPTQLP